MLRCVHMPLFFLFEILMVSIPREWVYSDRMIALNNAYSVVLSIMVIILAFFLKLLHMCKFGTKTYIATWQCKNANVNYGIESCLENHSKNLTLLYKHTRKKGTAATYCLKNYNCISKATSNNQRNLKDTANLCLSSSSPVDIWECRDVVSSFIFPVTVTHSFWVIIKSVWLRY